MKKLSIFVDKSGDFGECQKHAPYYIVTMVFHDQAVDISDNINFLNKSFVFHKIEYESKFKLEVKIAKELSQFIRDNLSYFQEYEKVILYYDNGQHELNRILNTVLATQLNNYDIRRVLPSDYRLFQVADLICTLELLRIKTESGKLSNSEERIFHSIRDLKRDFLKGIRKKEF